MCPLGEGLVSGKSMERLKSARSLCTEFVLLYLNGGTTVLVTDNSSLGHQFQGTGAVQLRGPTNCQLQAFAGKQEVFGSEQHAAAAHINSGACSRLVTTFLTQDLVPDLTLDRIAICRASIGSIWL